MKYLIFKRKKKTNLPYKSLERVYLWNFENYFPSIFLLFAIFWIIIIYVPFRNNKPKTNTSLRVKLIVFFFTTKSGISNGTWRWILCFNQYTFFFILWNFAWWKRGGRGKGDVKASKEPGKKKRQTTISFLFTLPGYFPRLYSFFFI